MNREERRLEACATRRRRRAGEVPSLPPSFVPTMLFIVLIMMGFLLLTNQYMMAEQHDEMAHSSHVD